MINLYEKKVARDSPPALFEKFIRIDAIKVELKSSGMYLHILSLRIEPT